MIHPRTELRYIDDEVHYGVFATAPLPKGTIIWALCRLDQRYTPAQIATFPAAYRSYLDKYSYLDAEGNYILCWDAGRYVNHACEPTSLAISAWAEILVRDVAPGEQITCEYGVGNLDTELVCRCGAPRCRGVIRADDVLVHGADWDRTTRDALPFAAMVPQPLRPFLEDPAVFDAIVRDPSQMPMHRALYHPRASALGGER